MRPTSFKQLPEELQINEELLTVNTKSLTNSKFLEGLQKIVGYTEYHNDKYVVQHVYGRISVYSRFHEIDEQEKQLADIQKKWDKEVEKLKKDLTSGEYQRYNHYWLISNFPCDHDRIYKEMTDSEKK